MRRSFGLLLLDNIGFGSIGSNLIRRSRLQAEPKIRLSVKEHGRRWESETLTEKVVFDVSHPSLRNP